MSYTVLLFLTGCCLLAAVAIYKASKVWNNLEVDETWDKPFL
jgi:hypothetical protein